MKTIAKILLVILFEILFIGALISSAIKFQILNYNFWQNTFTKHNVYQSLAIVSKNSFDSQINKEGGSTNDVSVLTDLITPENAKDVIDKNLQNFLSFVNGASSQINVYLPIDKVPKNLLPQELTTLKSEMPLTDLLTKFNFQNYQGLDLQGISHSGQNVNYFFIGIVSLELFILIILVLLTEEGGRFVAVGTAFVLSGGLTLFFVSIASSLGTALSNNMASKTSISAVTVGVIFPPVISEIAIIWRTMALILFLIGSVLFFVKKPGYNKSK